MDTDLPFIDEHQRTVPVPAGVAWDALTAWITSSQLGAGDILADLLGTDPRRAGGTIPEVGAAIPGFRVVESVPCDHIALAGRHRFSRYMLLFTLTSEAGRTIISARSYGMFPGVLGWGYRRLVVGSGAHRILTRRMLTMIERQVRDRAA